MGLLSELILLPLAPVRGVAWTVDQVLTAAEREQIETLRAELIRLERDLHDGVIDEEEFDRREDEILDRLEELDAGVTG
ncbi:gas vesicle protein [Allosaccharopolyspora coralli]|uniref:Gas vesicle protein n=1 Tax=Allosaccharopolyspora coralli TaxID=2665642 RepID=A0A5Q3QAC4_9PSEU|nr:gas vesicle protein GvpG [Allosaccharopolyspora coralli]QGK71333.1 gas vesicle protein [Allosaccharopolyspora coralli]